jgi:hypothetical protein
MNSFSKKQRKQSNKPTSFSILVQEYSIKSVCCTAFHLKLTSKVSAQKTLSARWSPVTSQLLRSNAPPEKVVHSFTTRRIRDTC